MVQESTPDGKRKPRDLPHHAMSEQPQTRGTPIHHAVASQPEHISTVPMAEGPAAEPHVGGTSTPIHDSPLQGGLFMIPQECSMLALPQGCSMPFLVHMLRVMMKKCAMSEMTWNVKARYSLTPCSD